MERESMSERNKPHNGRDADGNFRVRRVDVDDVETNPDGTDVLRDDVRTGGAVADTGALAGQRAAEIGERIEDNRENVRKLADREPPGR
jgi:hypothetical protein